MSHKKQFNKPYTKVYNIDSILYPVDCKLNTEHCREKSKPCYLKAVYPA